MEVFKDQIKCHNSYEKIKGQPVSHSWHVLILTDYKRLDSETMEAFSMKDLAEIIKCIYIHEQLPVVALHLL